MVSHALGFPLSPSLAASQGRVSAAQALDVSSSSTFLRPLATAVLVALSYYAGSQIGFFLTPANQPLATFWPPNAILLAAFLLTPVRQWWIILLAVLPAHFLVQLRTAYLC